MGRKHGNASSRFKVVDGGGGGRRRGLPPRAGNTRKKRPPRDSFEAARSKSGRRPRLEPEFDSGEELVEDPPEDQEAPPPALDESSGVAMPLPLQAFTKPEDRA